MTGAGSLEINLYNFEDDEFAESPYVLTSPRSLQACDMLGVKVCTELQSLCSYVSSVSCFVHVLVGLTW